MRPRIPAPTRQMKHALGDLIMRGGHLGGRAGGLLRHAGQIFHLLGQSLERAHVALDGLGHAVEPGVELVADARQLRGAASDLLESLTLRGLQLRGVAKLGAESAVIALELLGDRRKRDEAGSSSGPVTCRQPIGVGLS